MNPTHKYKNRDNYNCASKERNAYSATNNSIQKKNTQISK